MSPNTRKVKGLGSINSGLKSDQPIVDTYEVTDLEKVCLRKSTREIEATPRHFGTTEPQF